MNRKELILLLTLDVLVLIIGCLIVILKGFNLLSIVLLSFSIMDIPYITYRYIKQIGNKDVI